MEISLKTLARRSFTASIKSKEKARYGYAALFVMGKQGQKCIEILQYSTAVYHTSCPYHAVFSYGDSRQKTPAAANPDIISCFYWTCIGF